MQKCYMQLKINNPQSILPNFRMKIKVDDTSMGSIYEAVCLQYLVDFYSVFAEFMLNS